MCGHWRYRNHSSHEADQEYAARARRWAPDRDEHRANDADVRVSQTERDEVVSLLGRHSGDGRLDLDEFSERVGEVYSARTRGELRSVLRDLPALASPAARRNAVRRILAYAALSLFALMLFVFAGQWWVVFPMAFWIVPSMLGAWRGGFGGARAAGGGEPTQIGQATGSR